MLNTNHRGRGGFRGANGRGQGRGRGRGQGRGRGRGGRARGRGGGYDLADQSDFVVQMWPDNYASPGNWSPRSRGRGGSGSNPNSGRATPNRGSSSPRGLGRGVGDIDYQNSGFRGRRHRGSKLRLDAPLSSLLYAERPLLRPVVFVPSVHTRTLFQEEEEILQVWEEPADTEQSHVPTADHITRVFSRNVEQTESSTSDDSNKDDLEEMDFSDMSRIHDDIDKSDAPVALGMPLVEGQFTGFVVGATPTRAASLSDRLIDASLVDVAESTQGKEDSSEERSDYINLSSVPLHSNNDEPVFIEEEVAHNQNESTDFFIDTNPTPAALSPHGTADDIIGRTEGVLPLGHEVFTEPDEVIVYMAPHPRCGKAAPAISPPLMPSFPSTSVITGTTSSYSDAQVSTGLPEQPQQRQQSTSMFPAPTFDSVSFSFANSPSPKKQPPHPPAFTPSSLAKARLKMLKKEARAARKRVDRHARFRSFGAIMEEAQLRGQGKDPRWEQRRRDDSDVDWGDQDSVQDVVDELSNGVGGMDLDPDLNLDVEVLKRFATGMGMDGGRFVTMDDIADEERMRLEDAEDEDRGSSGDEEEDEVVVQQERHVIAEPLDEEQEEGQGEGEDEDGISSGEVDSDNNDMSPRAGFKARLERLRLQALARNRRAFDSMSGDSDDDEGVSYDQPSRADLDEDFVTHIEDLLAEDCPKQERNHLFRAIHNGNAAEMAEMSPAYSDPLPSLLATPIHDISESAARNGRQRYQDIPSHLQEQWEKDRAKKAENKRARREASLRLAADPLSFRKGGKKGRKAMLAAARLDSSAPFANRVVDMTTLGQQLRRFLADVGGPSTMALPPMEKGDRARVHELAAAFHVKSISKGAGKGRYTTLIKKTMSGVNVDEKKIGMMFGKWGKDRFSSPLGTDKGKGRIAVPRHKEGDEVGKAAPKIGQSNIGFKMLSSMGWNEGDRIGASADGLHVPLTAVIKNTKLGLGASR